MKLRDNKGFAGIDISIALIVLLIFIPIIFGIIYNVKKLNQSVNRESTAIDIAIDVLEKAKSDNIFGNIVEKEPYFTTVENVTYKVTFSIISHEYKPEDDIDDRKVVNVRVDYPVGKDVKSVDFSATFDLIFPT